MNKQQMHLIKLALRLAHNENFPNIKFEDCEVCQGIMIDLRKLIKNEIRR